MLYEERVNQKVAHWLTTLTVDDLRKYNPGSPTHRCKTDKDFEIALTKLKVFLASIVGKPGVERTYQFARGKDFGRLFCPKGMQNAWRAFRGALCKGLMTDIDMKNCHPVILLWICDTFGIDAPKLREYVENRPHHLAELGKVTNGKDRDACKRLFLVATNTNRPLRNIPYDFFNEYQTEIQDTIQPALMNNDELARFKTYAEEAARRREADGDEANEEGSFLNLVLCYTENELLMEVKAFLDSVEIETALLAFDGLMVYGDYYDHSGLLMVLHNRLKHKFGIDMYFDYKQHETTALDDMPTDFDPTVVLGDEWNMLHENKKDGTSWRSGVLFNINTGHLLDETSRARILSACHGQGVIEERLITWKFAALKLWTRAGLVEAGFEQAWAVTASSSCSHNSSTLRHYSRQSDESKHRQICKEALGLGGRTSFKEIELRDYFLKAVGDDVLCLHTRTLFYVWNNRRWSEDSGPIMANQLMDLVHDLFQGCLSLHEKKLSKLVAAGEGDSDAAKQRRDQLKAIASTANQYGNFKNQNVLNLIKNYLRSNPRHDNPFDNHPNVFCFTNWAYDLEEQRGNGGWFHPDKYDYLLMSCQKAWHQPTNEQMANVERWYADIQPNESMRKALISIHKSGLSGQQFQYFFVFTGGGGNGKDFLNDQFIYLLDKNGYAAIGHLDLLTKPPKSGPNPELRSLHKKRFVRFAEPNPGQKTEAIRLKNVDELTGCESVVARDCHSNDTDTHLHSTSALECNRPPACVGDKGNSAIRRWRWIEFPTTFTSDESDLRDNPARFKRIDPKLDDKAFVKVHYCALFKYLITTPGVWKPGESLDDYMPEATRTMAKEYLAQNDELSTWFLEQYEHELKVDGNGLVVNFVPIKEAFNEYKEHDIYKCMKAEEKRTFGPKKLKVDFEQSIHLKRCFVQANKVKLAATGKFNTQEGLIHYKRKRDEDVDEPSSLEACLNAQLDTDG